MGGCKETENVKESEEIIIATQVEIKEHKPKEEKTILKQMLKLFVQFVFLPFTIALLFLKLVKIAITTPDKIVKLPSKIVLVLKRIYQHIDQIKEIVKLSVTITVQESVKADLKIAYTDTVTGKSEEQKFSIKSVIPPHAWHPKACATKEEEQTGKALKDLCE